MSQFDLAVGIREDKRLRALKNTESSALETGGMFAGPDAFAARFYPDHSDGFVVQKRIEHSNRVAAAADTSDQDVGQASFALHDLAARFNADNALKIADHHWIGMRAKGGTEDVMSRANV